MAANRPDVAHDGIPTLSTTSSDPLEWTPMKRLMAIDIYRTSVALIIDATTNWIRRTRAP